MKPKIYIPIIIILVLILVGVVYYRSGYSTQKTNNTVSTNQPVSKSLTIDIQNFAFSPNTLTIKKGQTVTWINNDSATHNISSSSFSSSDLKNGESFKQTFNQSGTFGYSCGIHPSMQGEIVVK